LELNLLNTFKSNGTFGTNATIVNIAWNIKSWLEKTPLDNSTNNPNKLVKGHFLSEITLLP
jgi:hypothetical protein